MSLRSEQLAEMMANMHLETKNNDETVQDDVEMCDLSEIAKYDKFRLFRLKSKSNLNTSKYQNFDHFIWDWDSIWPKLDTAEDLLLFDHYLTNAQKEFIIRNNLSRQEYDIYLYHTSN